MLIVGSSAAATDAAIDRLSEFLRTPIHICVLPGPLSLPSGFEGTLVLRDVAALDREQQQQLLEWLDENAGRVQVVSATERVLFSEVEQDRFNRTLYYRLNTILEEVVGV
jgi:hypothetical protein